VFSNVGNDDDVFSSYRVEKLLKMKVPLSKYIKKMINRYFGYVVVYVPKVSMDVNLEAGVVKSKHTMNIKSKMFSINSRDYTISTIVKVRCQSESSDRPCHLYDQSMDLLTYLHDQKKAHLPLHFKTSSIIENLLGLDHDLDITLSNEILPSMMSSVVPLSPVDPVVQTTGSNCVTVTADGVYNTAMCSYIAPNFFKFFLLAIGDNDQFLGSLVSDIIWGNDDGFAVSSHTVGVINNGKVITSNFTMSENYQNSSLSAACIDSGNWEDFGLNIFHNWTNDNTPSIYHNFELNSTFIGEARTDNGQNYVNSLSEMMIKTVNNQGILYLNSQGSNNQMDNYYLNNIVSWYGMLETGIFNVFLNETNFILVQNGNVNENTKLNGAVSVNIPNSGIDMGSVDFNFQDVTMDNNHPEFDIGLGWNGLSSDLSSVYFYERDSHKQGDTGASNVTNNIEIELNYGHNDYTLSVAKYSHTVVPSTAPPPPPGTIECAPYSVSNTNYASQNYATCSFVACPGQRLEIAPDCPADPNSCSQNYYRLYDSNNYQASTAYGYTCDGSCVKLVYALTNYNVECQTYYIHQGCYGYAACSGSVLVYFHPLGINIRYVFSIIQVFI
jgi:hypothetical protein